MHLYSLKNIFSYVSFCQVKFSRHMYCAFPKCCHVYLEENGITLKTGKMITPCWYLQDFIFAGFDDYMRHVSLRLSTSSSSLLILQVRVVIVDENDCVPEFLQSIYSKDGVPETVTTATSLLQGETWRNISKAPHHGQPPISLFALDNITEGNAWFLLSDNIKWPMTLRKIKVAVLFLTCMCFDLSWYLSAPAVVTSISVAALDTPFL